MYNNDDDDNSINLNENDKMFDKEPWENNNEEEIDFELDLGEENQN